MNIQVYIAKRYVFSKSKNNAINIINRIAGIGIVVGAMALFVVLSVFSGLKDFSLSFTNETDPDLKVTSLVGKSFTITDTQEKQIAGIDGIEFYSKILEERVLFVYNDRQDVTFLKGTDSNYVKVTNIENKLIDGQWLKPNTLQVVIGYGISHKLAMRMFDFENNFKVFVPKAGRGMIENSEDAFNEEIIFPVGMYAISEDVDSKYVFSDLGLAQQLMEYSHNQISGIEIKTTPNANEAEIKEKLKIILNNKVKVIDRAQLNESLYKMLNTENIVVYLIFTLVIIIALFNLIGALIMTILDKKNNLKTLFNLGAEVSVLQNIFLFQGLLLTVISCVIGLVLGIILILLQQQFELIMISPTLAYPVVFSLQNVFIVMATIFVLGFIASLIASSRISKRMLN